MPKRLKLDMSDPANPLAKVKKVKINFSATYTGDDAWNQNILIPKLNMLLYQHRYSLIDYEAVQQWDKDGQVITNDEMKDYIAAKHGHDGQKCSSCPDPLKWREAEKLMQKAVMEEGSFMNRGHRGGLKVVYIMETKEERALRKKVDNKELKFDDIGFSGKGTVIEEY